jgi:hypothetical protein
MIRRIAVVAAAVGIVVGSGAVVPVHAAQSQAAATCVAATAGRIHQFFNTDTLINHHFTSLSEAPRYSNNCITTIYRHREGNYQYSWLSNIGRHRWTRSVFGEYKYFYQIHVAQGEWENNLWLDGAGLIWCANEPSACAGS